jgi:putative flavoprotein involved in K+ transport
MMGRGLVERTDTLVIGGGQAGLATSYWLTKAGVDHHVVDRRDRLGRPLQTIMNCWQMTWPGPWVL